MLSDLSTELTKGDEDIYVGWSFKKSVSARKHSAKTIYQVMCKPMPATDADWLKIAGRA